MNFKAFSFIVAFVCLTLVASGCGRSRSRAPRSSEKVRITRGGEGLGIDFDRYWPRAKVDKLSPEQRAKLLELALVSLKGNNWEHARDVLVSLGRDSFSPLIAQVESDDLTAAASAPFPVVNRSGVKTLGQLSHDVLLEIVEYHTNFKGQLPVRSNVAWAKWWEQNKSGLVLK